MLNSQTEEYEFEVSCKVHADSIEQARSLLFSSDQTLVLGSYKFEVTRSVKKYSSLDIYFQNADGTKLQRLKIKQKKSGKISVRYDAKEWIAGKKREIIYFKGKQLDDSLVNALVSTSSPVKSIVMKHCYKYGVIKGTKTCSDKNPVPHFFRIEHVKGVSEKLEDLRRSEYHIELEVSSYDEREQLFDWIKPSPHLSPLMKRHKYNLGALKEVNVSLNDVLKVVKVCPDIADL